MEKKTSLYFKNDKSDKEYHIQLKEVAGGWVVNFQFGRRGSTLKPGSKTPQPVEYAKAEKIYNAVEKEKLSEGYKPSAEAADNYDAETIQSKEILLSPQLLNMIEDVEPYLKDPNFVAQEKKDGERRLVQVDASGINGLNKKGQIVPLTTKLKAAFRPDQYCIVDGEIVGEQLFLFDILSADGLNLRNLGYWERLTLLRRQALDLGDGVSVLHTAQTELEKRRLYNMLAESNKEGIVFKNQLAKYSSGRPATGGAQVKFKFYKTATFVAGEITEGKRSVSLLIVDEEGQEPGALTPLRYMGKVTIPPNQEMPIPGDFIEVRYLYAYKGGCIFQATYLGVRNDCDFSDADIKQIIYKEVPEEV